MTSRKRPVRFVLASLTAAALGIALAALGLTASAFAVGGGTGEITGVVTDIHGNPLRNITVYLALPATGTSNDSLLEQSSILTDHEGGYTFPSQPVGNYTLTFSDASSAYLTAPTESVAVIDSQIVTVNESLHLGGVVDGEVTNQSGTPLPDIPVAINEEPGQYAVTNGAGNFSFIGLPHSGQITLQINGNANSDYPQNFGYGTRQRSVSAVQVDSGTVNVPATALAASSTISGVVDGATGKPLANVYVQAYLPTPDGTGTPLVTSADYNYQGVDTDAQGAFTLHNLPTGDIYLRFTPDISSTSLLSYNEQFLGGSSTLEGSTPVHLSDADSSGYEQVRLIANGSLSGKVTSSKGGAALRNVPVSVTPLAPGSTSKVDVASQILNGSNGYSVTSSSGAFTIPGLPAGTYQVSYNTQSSGASQPADDTVKSTVYIPANGKVTRNQAIGARTKITGTVHGNDSSTPVEAATVEAFSYDPTTHAVGPAPTNYRADTTITGSNGAYTLYLDAGTYVLRVTDPSGAFATGYLGGGSDPSDATTTKLVVGSSSLSSKNVVLTAAEGFVTATVLDSNGNPDQSPDQSGLGGVATLSRLAAQDGLVTSVYNEYSSIDAFPFVNIPDGYYQLALSATEGGYNPNLTSVPTTVDFTMAGGVLTEENGETPTATHDLGIITLNPATYVSDPQLVVVGDVPSVDSTTDLQIGQTVSALDGDWSPTPTQFYYQWYRDARPIGGATGQSYKIRAADVGHSLSVGLFVDDPYGLNSNLVPNYVTVQTDEVQPGTISGPTDSPFISGTAKVGSTLTAHVGTWSSSHLSFDITWWRDGDGSPVGHGLTYKAVAADAGTGLWLDILATQPGYTPLGAISPDFTIPLASGPKLVKAPKVTKSVVGDVTNFSVTPGTWSPSGSIETYEWRIYDPSDGSVLDFSNDPTLPNAPAGDRIEVSIVASKAGYLGGTDTIKVQSGHQVELDGTVALTGTATVGFPETVDTSTLVPSPSNATFTYQWYRGTTKLSGATKVDYTPVGADAGKALSVRVTGVETGYPTSAVASSVPVTIQAASSFEGGVDPTLTGTPAVGRTLTVVPGPLTPTPTSITYQWFHLPNSGPPVKISGATKQSYKLVASDLGKEILVVLTNKRSGYVDDHTAAETDDFIGTLAIQNVTKPTTGATAQVGQTLKATPGTWDISSTTYTYQWFDNDAAIIGATLSSYLVPASEMGDAVYVAVVAHKSGYGSSDAAFSEDAVVQQGTTPTASAAPVLSVAGVTVTSLKMGQTVTATSGTWSASGVAFSYQWQVSSGSGFVNIDGATTPQLLIDGTHDPADFVVGDTYHVIVTATRAGYDTGTVTSKDYLLKP